MNGQTSRWFPHMHEAKLQEAFYKDKKLKERKMRKKEKWMFKDAIVLASGKKATITKMQENNLDGTDYVYYIFCKLEGEKHSNPYHPGDIKELVVTDVK